jgi:hypothetical protein
MFWKMDLPLLNLRHVVGKPVCHFILCVMFPGQFSPTRFVRDASGAGKTNDKGGFTNEALFENGLVCPS